MLSAIKLELQEVEPFSLLEGLGRVKRKAATFVATGIRQIVVLKQYGYLDPRWPSQNHVMLTEYHTVSDRLSRLFSVFLSLPQGTLILHSFCTRTKCFFVAVRSILPHSESANT